MGARLGHRRRSCHGDPGDRQGAGRAGDRHLVERRKAHARERAGSRRHALHDVRPAIGDLLDAGHDVVGVVAGVKEVTDGGAHVVVDNVGEATWKRSLDSARPAGRVCVCGATSGPNPPAQLHRIWWKQLTIFGSTMGSREDFEAVYDLMASGTIVPVVDEVFPLADAAAAHERLEAGEQLGKVILRIPG